MSRLVLTASHLEELRRRLLSDEREACAVLFARAVHIGSSLARIVVREVQWPEDRHYAERSEVSAQLTPQFVAEMTQSARRAGDSLVFVHTHPFAMNHFSPVDSQGEKDLARFLESRIPGRLHAAMLLTPQVSIARVLGAEASLKVVGVGETLIWGSAAGSDEPEPTFDRQVRAFGAAGQAKLRRMRVAIVGLGGTGSIVAQQLSYLGVNRLLLIDPDIVERTNLNRLVGAGPDSVGQSKVAVAAAHARVINPSANITTSTGSVLQASTAEKLADSDFIFACTDSQGSRAVLNQVAYQYLIPTIDMGAVIMVHCGKISHIAGRTQMLAPGLGCMVCGNLLNPEAVRVDLLSDFERASDRYIVGATEPAPAVVSLNSTIASVAVTMFLNAVTGTPGIARLVNYNAISGTMRPGIIDQHPSCVVCSPHGALARADEWPLPARQT